jgi:hypothetical protein
MVQKATEAQMDYVSLREASDGYFEQLTLKIIPMTM